MADRISERGLALIQKFEGLVLHVYKCQAGRPTVGYGHCLTPAELAADRFAAGITKGEAEALLRSDVAWVEKAIAKRVRVALGQNQYDSLASMVFNTGESPLAQTLGKVLNAARHDLVPGEMMRWVHLPDKSVSKVLLARRAAEAHLWSTPDEEGQA